MAQLEVRKLEDNELCAWDMLVTGSAQGTVFHRSDWLVKNASLQNRNLVLLGCYNNEELIGGCSLFLSHPYNFLRLADSTVALTPYGGVMVAESGRTRQRARDMHTNRIITAFHDYFIRNGFDYVNLINSPGFTDVRAFTGRSWSPTIYYTYILPLHDNVLKEVSRNVRRNIQKAREQGITSTERFDPGIFWDLTVCTFAKQDKLPPVSEKHLTSMLTMIQEKGIGKMRIASTPSGEDVAAEVTLWDEKMAHSWSVATAPEHFSTGAVSLLRYDVFTSFFERDFRAINLMTGNVPHLSTFSSSFNPRLVPYYGVEYSRSRYRILKRLQHCIYRDDSTG